MRKPQLALGFFFSRSAGTLVLRLSVASVEMTFFFFRGNACPMLFGMLLEDGALGGELHRAKIVGGETAEDALGRDVLVDDWQRGEIVGAASLLDDGAGVLKHLVDGHGVHLAAVVVAGFDEGLEVAATD